jgi:hypothetical protein
MRECFLKVFEGIRMRFFRKLVVREGTYGTISVPKPIIDAWASVENIEIDFDEDSNTLVIVPKLHADQR